MSLLFELIERDGRRCMWCGRELWPADLTAEHLLPRSRRGHGTPENLAVACRRCNRERGTQSVIAYVRSRQAAGAPVDLALVRGALERLAASPRRPHAAYAARQLALLDGLGAPRALTAPGGSGPARR